MSEKDMKELAKKLGVDHARLMQTIAADLPAIPGVSGAFEASALIGGASIRGYARISLGKDSKLRTIILMILSDPDPAKGVEEVMASGIIKELPFINVHRHLRGCGLSVPEIYLYNRERGLIYIEDCGNVHLRYFAESGDVSVKREWFERAIRELVKVQVDCTLKESADFLGFHVRFDHKLLRWELDHFTEHAIARRFPGSPSKKDQERISRHFEEITAELLAGPYALQHRDYHMDNLLFLDRKIKVIDFQDALMGPLAYDLACLLYDRDTSALLGADPIEHLVDFYADELEKRKGGQVDRKEFRRNFELCVIHRMLKVVGRFHFIDQVKHRPEYLDFIPYMLPVIADYLGRGPRRRELLAIIASYLPELSASAPAPRR